ncbi:hypothetical protein B0H19DRAFT_1209995 [Mycena capillaripes]|nr:hypothetical protein B0H19DRAFT_1209995 [Mycena capillaripes]
MVRRGCVIDIEVGEDPRDATTIVADRGVYFLSEPFEGLSRQEELLNISHKKRGVQPTDLSNSYGLWIPMPEEGFLDEILRHNGLGDDLHDLTCGHCKTPYSSTTQIFKCLDCGQFLQCKGCCLSHHALAPLHVIKEWNGRFWSDTTLAVLGLVYQLGHGGLPCIYPDSRTYKMTVIEAPIIHQVRVRYCKCARSDHADHVEQLLRNAWYPASITDPATCATFKTLEAFQLYNVVGNLNVHDFIHAMERATDAMASTGMSWLPDRYKQFQRMARQWAFLKRVKRAGRGHDPAGVDATELRACTVTCWTCPYDGRNLPEDWREVELRMRFLYMLLLAVDANFRLKNRMRTNEIDDPSLGPGWSYWVEPQRYRRHLRKYVGEKDLSTCIAFAALLQKDTRLTTGLRASGVGGCVCARHECVRPNGIGDLQKGERYANMDYIVMSALFGFSLMLLTISYDIACQWKKKLPERNKKMPKAIRLPLNNFTLQCALPVWHASSHNETCQDDNSLSFKSGVGKSDGEGVEHVWSVLNPASYHTKDAGRGQRVDYLIEGDIGDALQRKFVVAVAERDRQVAAFKDVSATVEHNVRNAWKTKISKWEADPENNDNPYTLSRKDEDCPTEAEVRLEVRKDEEAQIQGASSPVQGRSATAFLIVGLQIEEAQRRILAEVAGATLMTADHEGKLHDWRRALLAKIKKFRDLQEIYMPGAAPAIVAAEAARDPDLPPPKAEKIKLWMPSQMRVSKDDPLRGCIKGLLNMEAKLRTARCNNALAKLRARLHAKRHFIAFRNDHVTGQIQSTKARTLIGEIGDRVDACVQKYRHARSSLISLSGEADASTFRELRQDDVRLDGDAGESDAAARKKLAMIGAGRGARAPRNAPGTLKRTMSWIWTAAGALDDEKERLHDSVRVEWSRAYARKKCWEEESTWWRAHVDLRDDDVPRQAAAGIHAYALKQADVHDRLAAFFQRKWNVSVIAAAQRLVQLEEAAAKDEEADLEHFFNVE